MLRDGMTIREAAEVWVHEMNAIPQGVIAKMMRDNPEEWQELTVPAPGDRVYVYEHGSGTIDEVMERDDELVFVVELDEGQTAQVECERDDFEVEYDDGLPMWGTMWTFGDSADDYWLEELGGLRVMSECGFRVYENEDLGYVFGIDGAGYDFYESHWVPLYKKRGLKWHDERAESGSFFMTERRKADLYDDMLGYITELISDSEELVKVLKSIGFSDKEIAYEGLEVVDDE